MTTIGSLNEKPLHAALKEWYRRRGDLVEVATDGFVVDLVRAGLLIEIQTGSFAAMRRKLDRLLDAHSCHRPASRCPGRPPGGHQRSEAESAESTRSR
ncbi:MAG TPA: hypothetical protein DCY40_03685 [Actinobacteria bacterium]|nr:hypothetical protein [Actinomycetota bacterium]